MKTSRSHVETFQECPRKRLNLYHAGEHGTGYSRAGYDPALETGTLTHKILALRLSSDASVTEIIRELVPGFVDAMRDTVITTGDDWEVVEPRVRREAALAEGLVRAWCRVRMPFVLETYDVLSVEEEDTLELAPGVEWMSRLDAVLRRKSDGEISALEFKTTGSNRSDVLEAWKYDHQLLSHMWVLEQKYKRPAYSVMLELLYKGYKKNDEYYSPLMRGWRRSEINPMTGVTENIEYAHEYQRGAGWEQFDPWREDAFPEKPPFMTPMEYWCEHVLDYETLRSVLFYFEIFRSDEEVEEWYDTTWVQEDEITRALAEDDKSHFPAYKGKHCFSGRYFRRCPSFEICFRQISGDPLASGLYKAREPHHEQEVE